MLSRELSIQHPKTIGDYINLLESLDVLFVQSALIEEKLCAAPKMARKLLFLDPFIYRAISAWLSRVDKSFKEKIFENIKLSTALAKSCAITHFQRNYPTYYIKSVGEIDLAYISDHRFWPILISWTNQLRTKDLKELLKYSNGKILTNASRSGMIEYIRTEPLPFTLWKL